MLIQQKLKKTIDNSMYKTKKMFRWQKSLCPCLLCDKTLKLTNVKLWGTPICRQLGYVRYRSFVLDKLEIGLLHENTENQ